METGISGDELRKAVNGIISSSVFHGSKRLRRFLKFVAEKTLNGEPQNLTAYPIAIAAYEREADFDPQIDPIIRVEAGRLRRALKEYYLTEGKHDSIVINMPKGGYRLTFGRADTIRPLPPEKKFEVTPDLPPENHSVAVLPIRVLYDADELNHFVDGLTEELTAELARYQDLVVIASQSTLPFKENKKDYSAIGFTIRARFLLEGSYRQNAGTYKITFRLIDSSSSQQVWSSSYKGRLDPGNLIHLQEQTAQSVISCIADQFGAITRLLSKESPKQVPANIKSYDAVLRFYQFENQLTKEAFKSALVALERTVESDPEYGLAWSTLGHLYADNHALGFCDIKSSLVKAEQCAKKGISLIPNNQFAHDALALVYFQLNNKKRFLEQANTAIGLNPNAPYIVGVTGWHLILFGEWERGLELLRKGIKLNPLYPSWFHLALFLHQYHLGNYEEALTEAKKFNFPELFWDQVMRAVALVRLNRKEDARLVINELETLHPNFNQDMRKLVGNYIKVPDKVDSIVADLMKVY